MEGIITGVSVAVVVMIINTIVSFYKNRKSRDKEAIRTLIRCVLTLLTALKKSGVVNGDCDNALEDLNEFLIEK